MSVSPTCVSRKVAAITARNMNVGTNMAKRWTCYAGASLAVVTSHMVQAQTAVVDPAQTATSSAGTPSDATATVSPSTVADAVTRGDDRRAADDGRSALGVSIGSSLAYGDFGAAEDSRVFSTALGARFTTGALRFTASVPYLNIRSRGILFSGIDSTPVIAAGAKPGAPRVTASGIGDFTLGAAYTTRESGVLPEVELSGRIKLPTASDSSHLSTGKTDVSAGLQLTKTVGRIAPFVSATYRWFGDPAIIDLRNGFAASAGVSVGFGARAVALFSYHYAAAATRLVRDSHELFGGASAKLPNSDVRVTGFATVGLSSGAAAASGGLSLALDF